jgi:NADPH-dependent 2,4-dienoyl-CoA reductase/sulfur reductase-like enzyme
LKKIELLIIGAGPAGLAAAIEAVRAGASVTIMDENPRVGGQIFRQLHDGFVAADPKALGHDYQRGQTLLAEFDSVKSRVEYLAGALVWGIFENNELAILRGENSCSVRFRKLIISSGAYDRPVPFPGWTLPGVFTAGGAQSLVKTQRVMPGENMLLVGSGPLQLALANQIADAGGKVAAIVEAGRIDNWLKLARASWGQWMLLTDAARYVWGIRKAKIPLLRNHIIIEARGIEQVEEAVVAEVDTDWRPKSGSERVFAVDTVTVGYGFVPSVELTLMAGCDHRYEPLLGGWIPVRDENMKTNLPDVYAVGDCAGVAGSLVAIDEGRIAGLAAARSIDRLPETDTQKRMRPCRKRLTALNRFRTVLDSISLPRPGLHELSRDDTIICRCRDIPLKEIKKALHEGATDLNEIKRRIGIGMGPCQGRMCGPGLLEIAAREKKELPTCFGFLNPRPPLKPVPLTALANHADL